ncbi:unnamed protein product [Brassica oleracea]|uniref:Uncharacterized protein n=2 Tax=Brassica oleracea TaxID=3712 RepID=A0A0D3DS69_BRAOL|nr:unnamed protein product [Brassica oleracea]
MAPRSLNGFRDHYVDTAAEESELRKKEGREVLGEWKQLAQRTHAELLIVKVKPFLYETFLLLRSLKLPRTSIVVVMYCKKDSTYGTKVLSKTDLKRSCLRDPLF